MSSARYSSERNKVPLQDKLSREMRQITEYPTPDTPAPAPDDYPAQRRNYARERQHWNQEPPAVYALRQVTVPTGYGPVNTRIYRPTGASPATLFYLHGGGFILGSLDTHDRIMRLLANYSGCDVVGIDYTLSPEARFPQAIEETIAVCRFFEENAQRYQLSMADIGFAGDSAGAMLAMASTLWLREHPLACARVRAALLWYGLFGLQDSVTRRLYGNQWDGLRAEDIAGYEQAYLRTPADRESPWYCLFNNDLTHHVPPCFLAGAEYDPLLDDSVTLHQILRAHHQPSVLSIYPGTLHGFLHYSREMQAADNALRDGARFFTQQLAG
ncbi:acetyl esterase [Shimwellia blattae]|nr:acetyl esterase [Shimwellia blattae]GAB79512.1 acetyl esterase [Shimwellia blattae DSM 4481 = NBRC 105725]VDY65418.1 Acetyl esterase [Shimwellia blattae]VEC24539.1 Acetyl esterase [Shimwellia blattae]